MLGGYPSVPASSGGEADKRILVYGSSSSTEWKINNAFNTFNPNCYVEVGKEGLDAKIMALSMYRGVMRPYPHPRSAEYITGLAAMRGGQWGCNYAEAFEIVLRKF